MHTLFYIAKIKLQGVSDYIRKNFSVLLHLLIQVKFKKSIHCYNYRPFCQWFYELVINHCKGIAGWAHQKHIQNTHTHTHTDTHTLYFNLYET